MRWSLLFLALMFTGCGSLGSPLSPSPVVQAPVSPSPATNPNLVLKREPILCPPEFVPFLTYCQFRLEAEAP